MEIMTQEEKSYKRLTPEKVEHDHQQAGG